MSKKILLVFGATGQQGGSVVDFVLNDHELSQTYALRAISRDLSKPAVRALVTKGVEVVQGDILDSKSLERAFEGVWGTFIMSSMDFKAGKAQEYDSVKAAADTAVAAGANYIIFSSLPHTSKITDGKLTNTTHFDVKAELEEYIRSLPIQSAFYAPAIFMSNYRNQSAPQPSPAGDGTYVIASVFPPTLKIPIIDAGGDTGKWVGAALAAPEQFNGKFIAAASGWYTPDEIAAAISHDTGKTVRYQQVPEHVFAGFLPAELGADITEMWIYIRDYEYYGPGTKQMVNEAASLARGKLTTFEEYLKREPVLLQ